jgi:hypothetical protein
MAEKDREPQSVVPPPPPRQPDPALKGYLERQNDGRSEDDRAQAPPNP